MGTWVNAEFVQAFAILKQTLSLEVAARMNGGRQRVCNGEAKHSPLPTTSMAGLPLGLRLEQVERALSKRFWTSHPIGKVWADR